MVVKADAGGLRAHVGVTSTECSSSTVPMTHFLTTGRPDQPIAAVSATAHADSQALRQPTVTAGHIAVELGNGSHEIRRAMERNHTLASELLGLDRSKDRHVIATAAAAANDGRAEVIALGVVLGDIEEATGVHTWRNPSETMRRYFAFLAANGYTLTNVEQIAAGVKQRKPRAARSSAAA